MLNAKHLLAATSIALLSGCQNAPLISQAPEPRYPSCETVRYLHRADVPDAVWRDVLGMVVVMEQIRETMPPDERPEFGECKL